MKKLTLLLMALAILTSCSKKEPIKVKLTYAVYYNPLHPDTITVIVDNFASVTSHRGTNIIYLGGIYSIPIECTSAPIKIIKQTLLK